MESQTGEMADDPVSMTMLSIRATARYLGISSATLRAWSDCGVGPLPDDRGRYEGAAVTAWMEDMTDQLSLLLGPTVDATSASLLAKLDPWG